MICPNAAGIDIGANEHYVAVPSDRTEEPVRRFGTFTSDLKAIGEWLLKCGVETVAMESTGVYWIPIYQMLEEYGFEVKLVNARHVKNVPGRKTDVQDCQWLQQLHSYGLLTGSFRPEGEICVLRSYLRQRQMLVSYGSRHIQHMQKALNEMNLHLHHVISDITGVTGMTIIRAIVSGERDCLKLAAMRNRRIKSDLETIAKALEGDYREELLFNLRQSLELYDYYRLKIVECDQKILAHMQMLPDSEMLKKERANSSSQDTALIARSNEKLRKKRSNKRKVNGNRPTFDCASELHRIMGVDLTRIDGIDESTAQLILAETGLNIKEKWSTEGHFASWLGLCPDNEITGGKVRRRSTRKVVSRVSNALRMCAQSLFVSDSALGAFARRIRARRGAQIAITAAAHKLARLVYRMLTLGQEYVDAGQAQYEERYKMNLLNNLARKAKQFGYELTRKEEPATVVP